MPMSGPCPWYGLDISTPLSVGRSLPQATRYATQTTTRKEVYQRIHAAMASNLCVLRARKDLLRVARESLSSCTLVLRAWRAMIRSPCHRARAVSSQRHGRRAGLEPPRSSLNPRVSGLRPLHARVGTREGPIRPSGAARQAEGRRVGAGAEGEGADGAADGRRQDRELVRGEKKSTAASPHREAVRQGRTSTGVLSTAPMLSSAGTWRGAATRRRSTHATRDRSGESPTAEYAPISLSTKCWR